MSNLLRQLTQICKADEKKARWLAHVAICESKQRFWSKALAKKYCARAISKGAEPTLKPYKCKVCKQFHLTRNS